MFSQKHLSIHLVFEISPAHARMTQHATDEISTVDSRASKIFHNSTMLQRRSPHSRLLLITLIKVTDRSLPNVNSKENSYGWLDTSIILLRTF